MPSARLTTVLKLGCFDTYITYRYSIFIFVVLLQLFLLLLGRYIKIVAFKEIYFDLVSSIKGSELV